MPTEKWYLNLVPGVKGNSIKTCGTKIDLVAKRKTFHSRGKGGKKKVEWTFARDLRDFDEKKIDPAEGVLQLPGLVEELDDSSFRNSITLPPVTNVRYTVSAKKPAQGQGATGNVEFAKDYETWRLLDYDVYYMDDGCKKAYDAVKPKLLAAFAAVGIELKESKVSKTKVVETATDREPERGGKPGYLLTHLYDSTKELSNPDRHLLLVIVKDIVSVKSTDVSWNLVRGDDTRTKFIKLWSTGTKVHYECPIQIMKDDPAKGTVAAVLTPDVPPETISRLNAHTVEIALNNDALRALEEPAKTNHRKFNLKATLVGTRAVAYAPSFYFDHRAKVDAPAVNGTTQVWATYDEQARRWTLHVKDEQKTWADPAVQAARLVVQRRRNDQPGAVWEEDSSSDVKDELVVVDGRHELRLDVTTRAKIVALLRADAPVVESRGVKRIVVEKDKKRAVEDPIPHTLRLGLELKLLHGGAAVEMNIDLPIERHASNNGKLGFTYVDARRSLQLWDDSLTFDAERPLRDLALRAETAPVQIPAGKATRDESNKKQLTIDLDDPSLDAVRTAFVDHGARLQFVVTVRMQQSVGGYSPPNERYFVALSTIRLTETETDETNQKRLLMCMLHEIAHAHNLVSQTESFYTATSSSSQQVSTWYNTAFGGAGTHCSHNAELVPSGPTYGRLPTSSGQIYLRRANAGPGDKLCVMYHDLDTLNGEPTFCAVCSAQLRLCGTLPIKTKV